MVIQAGKKTNIKTHLGVQEIPQRSGAGANSGAHDHLVQGVALEANPVIASFEVGFL